jgi:hypothetical protein
MSHDDQDKWGRADLPVGPSAGPFACSCTRLRASGVHAMLLNESPEGPYAERLMGEPYTSRLLLRQAGFGRP